MLLFIGPFVHVILFSKVNFAHILKNLGRFCLQKLCSIEKLTSPGDLVSLFSKMRKELI